MWCELQVIARPIAALDCGSVSKIDPPTAKPAQSIPTAPTRKSRRIRCEIRKGTRAGWSLAFNKTIAASVLYLFLELCDRTGKVGPNFFGVGQKSCQELANPTSLIAKTIARTAEPAR
jgi:hypothetical protein